MFPILIYILLSLRLVTTATQKCDISGSLDPSILPITRSYSVSSMRKVSVCPVEMDSQCQSMPMDNLSSFINQCYIRFSS